MDFETMPVGTARVLYALLDHLGPVQDEGPEGSGWKSKELMADMAEAERILQECGHHVN